MHSEHFESESTVGQMVMSSRGGATQKLREMIGVLVVRLGMWIAGVRFEVRPK